MNTQQILNAEMANNQSVLLMGPPGCGKTRRAEISADKEELFEAIIFALIIEIKNYDIFFEQLKQQKQK